MRGPDAAYAARADRRARPSCRAVGRRGTRRGPEASPRRRPHAAAWRPDRAPWVRITPEAARPVGAHDWLAGAAVVLAAVAWGVVLALVGA